MGKEHHYWCDKCETERGTYDWWPNWIPGVCPAGGRHQWEWKKRVPTAKLERAIETMDKRDELLQKKIDLLKLQAQRKVKEGTPQAKQQAMALLKKKKMFEDQLAKTQANRANLEKMQTAIEEAEINKVTLESQMEAAKSMKGMDANKIAEELEGIRDTIQTADEISAAITQPLFDDGIDEDELLGELGQLEQDIANEELAAVAVPSKPLPTKSAARATSNTQETKEDETDEEAEFRALEAELQS